MISYLSNSMRGIEAKDGRIRIVDRIRPLANVEEPFKIIDFLEALNHVRKMGYSNKIKVGITGPVTFGFSAALAGAGPYGNIRNVDLYVDAAFAVNKILKKIQSYEGLTQIDEPGISAGFLDLQLAYESLSIATEGLDPRLTSIHVCGKLSLETIRVLNRVDNVETLSLEFAGSPKNIDLLSNFSSMLSKKIGIGCMRVNITSKNDLTTVSNATETIKTIASKIGTERIAYIHPNCGLRGTEKSLALRILRSILELSSIVL
jgi:methionine synthase II (cobalamin-independent)